MSKPTWTNPRDIEAHLQLRGAYDVGLGNLPYEEKAARRFAHHLKAAELGAGAIHSLALARIYRAGAIAVDVNETEALRWYKRAIEQGSIEAAHELQSFYKQRTRAGGDGAATAGDTQSIAVWRQKRSGSGAARDPT
jgi:TPR repeat protein